MKRTAQSIRVNNDGAELMGEITCEVTGEWAGGIKVWTEIGKTNGKQYSLVRAHGRWFFILEAE